MSETLEARATEREQIENKRWLESKSADILEGKMRLRGKSASEFMPEMPSEMRGHLLKGQRSHRHEPGTIEDAKRKHQKMVAMGYLSADVKVKYNNDGTYTVING